jgi:hypothetical protein
MANLTKIVEELNRRKAKVDRMESELKEEVTAFHKYAQEAFKLKPSNQPLSMADIAHVIAEAFKMDRE